MKILLAADGSDFARSSLDFLARIPLGADTELAVVTVIPDLKRDAADDTDTEIDALQVAIVEEAERVLEDVRERASRKGLDATGVIRTGSVAHEIVECSAEMSADLVVVGPHGLRGLERFLLGSVARHVVMQAPGSVLIVRADPAPPTGSPRPLRIVVAVDGSEPSRAAVAQIAALARTPWCAVRVVSVLELVMPYRMDIRQRLTEGWRHARAQATRHVEQAAATLSGAAIDVQTAVLESGCAGEAILDAATEFDADLIAVGGTGKGRIERVVLGSVSSRVTRHATCSVWVAR